MRPPALMSRSLLGKLRLASGNGVSVKAARSSSAMHLFSEPTDLRTENIFTQNSFNFRKETKQTAVAPSKSPLIAKVIGKSEKLKPPQLQSRIKVLRRPEKARHTEGSDIHSKDKVTRTFKTVGPSASTVRVKELRTIEKKEYSGSISKIYSSRTFEKVKHNTLQMLKLTNATPIRSHDGVKFGCFFCKDTYVDPRELKTHTIEQHEYDDKNSFEKGRGLAYHMAKLDITALHCKLCKLGCETVQEIFEHLVNTHDVVIHTDVNNQILPFKFVGENLTCFVCQYNSTSFKTLQAHMLRHFGGFHCDTCGKSVGNSSKLTQHQKSHSSGTFKCDKCEKVFATAQRRYVHRVRVHTRPMLYKCGFCSEKFQSYDYKLKHLVAKHDAPSHTFKCHACDKMFRKASLLSRHVRKDHLMEKQHECSYCHKAFFGVRHLKTHMITHDDTLVRLQCDNCLKYFKTKNSLKNHMKIHMDDRRFECDQCGMAFVYKVSWKSHMKKIHGYEVSIGTKY